jgi:outer membrane murein-binding lipoprotein Lpp
MNRKSLSIALLVLVLFMAGCPKRSDIDKAASASRELAHDTVSAEQVVKALYQSGKLSLVKKDFFADKLSFIAREGTNFNNLVVKLDLQEKAGTLPANAAQLIAENFQPIAQAFADLLAEIQRLPKDDAKQLTGATADLKGDVEAIKGVK